MNNENYFYWHDYRVFYRTAGTGKNNKAVLLIHGKGSNSNYIGRIIKNSLLNEYAVFSPDLPGWGRSSGPRGHIDSFKIYFDLLNDFINEKINADEFGSLFIMAESMGSLIAFNLALNYNLKNLKGLVFCPGIFYVKDFNGPLHMFIIKMFSLLFPHFTKKGKSKNITKYTDDPEMIAKLNADPLWIKDASFRLIYEIKKYLDSMRKDIAKLDCPLLVIQGLKDHYFKDDEVMPILDIIAAKKGSRVILLENCKHWVAINMEINEVRDEIEDWINGLPS